MYSNKVDYRSMHSLEPKHSLRTASLQCRLNRSPKPILDTERCLWVEFDLLRDKRFVVGLVRFVNQQSPKMGLTCHWKQYDICYKKKDSKVYFHFLKLELKFVYIYFNFESKLNFGTHSQSPKIIFCLQIILP